MKRLFAFFAVAAIAAMSAAQTIYDFIPGARQGDVQSMYNLGVCYENGYGCSPNPSQAVYWYEKAANAGMPEACVNLGYCYEKGIGTKQSYAQAAYYYMEAALKGNPGRPTWHIVSSTAGDAPKASTLRKNMRTSP